MSDPVAASLALVLALTAIAGFAGRDRLQPTRAGAVAYLAGAVTWGLALFALWFAWSATNVATPGCAEHACDEVGSALESRLDQLPGEIFLGADVVDAAPFTD